ncbi:MAG: SBBP repeat-containing protein [Fimbriimonadaceae bacterium]|nr:SBBP repeat-containing protein [Chitinophagales bacterium]
MIKHITVFFLSLFFVLPSFGQYLTLNWANKLTAPGYDIASEIEIYNNTHIYAIGHLSGMMDFDPSGTYTLPSTGFDYYLAKYTTSNSLSWVVDWSTDMYDVAVDNSGNAYVLGAFSSTLDFDPGVSTVNLSSGSGNDMVIVKMNSSGSFVWAKNMGNTISGSVYPKSIAVDASGNIYVCGYYYYTQDFDPNAGVVNITSAGSDDIFFAKYDNSGNLLWVNSIGSTSSDNAFDITVDNSGNVFIGGYFYGTADFDPGATSATLSSGSSTCGFFAKYSTDGNYVFAKQILGTSSSSVKNIILDNTGNILITGNYAATCDFDPSATTYNITGVSGSSDPFFAKYSATGEFNFVRSFGSNVWIEEIRTIRTDDAGNIYIVGIYTGTMDMDPGAGTVNLTSAVGDGNYSFIARYNDIGNYNWAYQISSNNEMGSMAIDNVYSIYTTGYYGSPIDVDVSGSTYTLTVTGFSFDAYIAKYTQSGIILPLNLISFTGLDLGHAIQLNWITASENNIAYFEILKSEDGINYFVIGKVDAAGFSSEEIEYTFEDDAINPLSEKYYYKLKITDQDGSFIYSNIIQVQHAIDAENVTVYPNPASGHLIIQLSEKPITGKVRFFSMNHQVMPEFEIKDTFLTIDISTWSKGMYFIQYHDSGNNYYSKKFMVE